MTAQDTLESAVPWLRTLVAIPLCVITFNAVHSVGEVLSPHAYEELLLDSQRLSLLGFIMLAGVAATFVVVAVSRHHAWLHVSALLVLGLAIDLIAVLEEFADQPLWFRALVIGLLPVQALAGKFIGMLTWKLGGKSKTLSTPVS